MSATGPLKGGKTRKRRRRPLGDQRRTKRQRPLNDDFVVVTEKEEARVKKMMYKLRKFMMLLGTKLDEQFNERFGHWKTLRAEIDKGESEYGPETYLPEEWMWEVKKKVERGTLHVKCTVCDDVLSMGERGLNLTQLKQHFAGKAHLAQLECRARDWQPQIYTNSDLDDEALERCVEEMLVKIKDGKDLRLSKETIIYRVMVARMLHDLGIPMEVLKNPQFQLMVAGKLPNQQLIPRTAVRRSVSTAHLLEECLVKEEMSHDRCFKLLGTEVIEARTPYSIFHDGSDLFKRGLSCTIVRWVDEQQWVIRMRMNTMQRPTEKDAPHLAMEIQRGFVDAWRPAVIIGDGASAQVLGMLLASGELKPENGHEGLITEYINGRGGTIVCLAHQIGNAGGKFWTNDSLLGEFTTGWRSLIGGYTGATFASKWREQIASGSTRTVAAKWFGKSTNPGSPTRWWTAWEMLADILHHKNDLLAFVHSTYFQNLSSAAATNIKRAVDNSRLVRGGFSNWHTFLIHLTAVRIYGEPLVQATYALESAGFIAPMVAEKLNKLKVLIDDVAEPDGPMTNAETGRFSEVGMDRGMLRAVRQHAFLPFYHLARIFKWSDSMEKVRIMFGDQPPPAARNKKREACIAASAKLFKLTKVCIPHAHTEEEKNGGAKLAWYELVNSLPEAARGMGDDHVMLLNAVEVDLLTYVQSRDVVTFTSKGNDEERARYLWNWWGERRERWCGLARVVALVALLLPSSAPVERAFSSTSKFSSLQSSMGDVRAGLTLMVAFNEKARRSELERKQRDLPS